MPDSFHYEKGLVSLVTPGWNGRAFVHRLLDSIIAQTYRPIQYIYVDDGSTDGTAEVVEAYKDKFTQANIAFTFVRQENAGICSALMTGFQEVRGEFLSNPEYDDFLLPDSVEKRVRFMRDNPDSAVVVADAWVVYENCIDERKTLLSRGDPSRFDTDHFKDSLMSRTIFNAACYMVRMDSFDETHSGRQLIDYEFGAAQQILLPLYYRWKRGFIDEPLSVYVRRSGSLGSVKQTLEDEVSHDLKYKGMLFKVLDGIQMDAQERDLYKKSVELNVQKDFLDFSRKYGSKRLWRQAYHYLKTNDALPADLKPFGSGHLKYGFWSIAQKAKQLFTGDKHI